MFTGIITDVGEVRGVEKRGDTRFAIGTGFDTDDILIGASICCHGACLTVVDKGADWFAVDASAETLGRTVLGTWRVGTKVNLERSLRIGDELGGHIVSGHVDGVATVVACRPEGDSLRISVEAPADLVRFIAPKGSIALNGASLTVNEVDGARFGINLIPHTRARTTFGAVREGDGLNLEVDILARYVARLEEARPG